MASYKAGFDPTSRPRDTSRSRRLGTYMQQSSVQPQRTELRDADILQTSGQMDVRIQAGGRIPQPGTGRPRMRDPSPTTRPRLEETRTGSSSSGFGNSRPIPKPTTTPKPYPELRTKGSRNVLRRKPSTGLIQEGMRPRAERQDSSSSSRMSSGRRSQDAVQKSTEAYNEVFSRPPRTKTPVASEPQVYPELDRYRARPEPTVAQPPKLATQDLPPANSLMYGTPVYSSSSGHSHRYSGSGYSASPSTRFSESPAPGGAYSRDTTPTSMSSQSPGIHVKMKSTTPRLRQVSPAMIRPPPVSTSTRRRAGDVPSDGGEQLPSLRESMTSSSSNSTVKGDGNGKEKGKDGKKKNKRLSPLPPSPPPRKSSQKLQNLRSDEPQQSPSKPSQAPAKPVMTSPIESPIKMRSVTSPVETSIASRFLTSPSKPSRPSRDGTLDLHAQVGVPVVQSNMTGLPQKRLSSLPMPRTGGSTQPSPTIRPQLGPRIPSRNNPSPSPILPSPREATPAPSGLGIIPVLKPQPLVSRSISRTPSPSIPTSKPRFGFFGRRNKTVPEAPAPTTRKGPAAGTGHEGYGKYAASNRGRSSSVTGYSSSRGSFSGASIATSTSQESVSTTRTHDPFLLDRMSPVIIAGGGEIKENRNTSEELLRIESNPSLWLGGGRPSTDSKDEKRGTLWPSPMPNGHSRSSSASKRISAILPSSAKKGRRPSDSSDDRVGQSSLALRQRIYASTGTLALPRSKVISPSTTSLDRSILSDDSQPEIGIAKKGTLTKFKKPEKKAKPEGSKWNFFHRSGKQQPPPPAKGQVQVVVGKPSKKAVPHYALLDSSDDQTYPEEVNLETLLADAQVVGMSNEELDKLVFGEGKRVESIDSKTAPVSEPIIKTPIIEKPAPIFSSPEPIISTDSRPTTPQQQTEAQLQPQRSVRTRPSRLPQVGRIPKVVSARPEATSPKSFSRPFARLSTLQPIATPDVIDQESLAAGPSPTKEQAFAISQSADNIDKHEVNHKDFLSFPARKGSEGTTNSSSSGRLSLTQITAVVPAPNDPLAEDEMWDEYDDLMGDDGKAPVSATSSRGHPFQYEDYETRLARRSKMAAARASALKTKGSPLLKSAPTLPSINDIPRLQVPVPSMKKMSEQERESMCSGSSVYSVDVPSRLRDALQTIPSPTTPLSFSEFFSGYADRNRSTDVLQNSAHKSLDHILTTGPDSEEMDNQESSPIFQVNLRVGSMTVSKWLTFGQVLYSPAREWISGGGVVGNGEKCNVLVIDGLGNDDWSFYAAETYPQATFYNVSPSPAHPPPTAGANGKKTYPTSPNNHVQVPFSPLSPFSSSNSTAKARLPFKTSTFHLTILRFPPALPESTYKHLVSECKRVLKPGGYLEYAILDLDMVNMGPRTRRAVRSLKVKLRDSSKGDAFIGSTSDAVLKAIGGKNFEGVRSCVLGVPVASPVAGSVSGSEKMEEKKSTKKEKHMSLTDLLHSPTTADTDADITKMVARVGRWWYGRCYESDPTSSNDSTVVSASGSNFSVGFNGSQPVFGGIRGANKRGSMLSRTDSNTGLFSDKAVLTECESWSSSFKLCVGFARKPSLKDERHRRSESGSSGSRRGSGSSRR